MAGLILEGGTFRPIFSAGIMDVMVQQGIEFPYVIGVSAGITNGVSYVSKQVGRNLDVLLKYRHDKRYMGAGNLLKCQSLFGLDFIYSDIPEIHNPFDYDTYYSYQGRVLVGVTNAVTGKAEYLDGLKMDEKNTMLRATCAIPFVFPTITIDGVPYYDGGTNAVTGKAEYLDGLKMDEKNTMLRATCAIPFVFPTITIDGVPYYDGGLADPIPIRKAIADGNEKNLIILTRCKGYRKELSKQNQLAAKILKHKYPNLVPVLLNRHLAYNETLEYCEQLEKEGKALILRPSEPIDSFEKDLDKLKHAYDMGVETALMNLDKIKELLKEA